MTWMMFLTPRYSNLRLIAEDHKPDLGDQGTRNKNKIQETNTRKIFQLFSFSFTFLVSSLLL